MKETIKKFIQKHPFWAGVVIFFVILFLIGLLFPDNQAYNENLEETAPIEQVSNKAPLIQEETAPIEPSPKYVPPTDEPEQEETQNSGTEYICSSDYYNCGDFSTCSEVMQVFNFCSSDVHQLDRDGDGVPCESLCN